MAAQLELQPLALFPTLSDQYIFPALQIWIMAAQFEVRQLRLDAARKILGMAIGMCPKVGTTCLSAACLVLKPREPWQQRWLRAAAEWSMCVPPLMHSTCFLKAALPGGHMPTAHHHALGSCTSRFPSKPFAAPCRTRCSRAPCRCS